MLSLVEHLELAMQGFDHRGVFDHNGILLLDGPRTLREHLDAGHLNAFNFVGLLLIELNKESFRQIHIFEHGKHLLTSVESTLGLELFYQLLLNFFVLHCLVEKTQMKVLNLPGDETVSLVEAAEKTDDLGKSFLDLRTTQLADLLGHEVVNKDGHELWWVF